MVFEAASQREFAELVSDHVFSNEDRNESLTVMNVDRMTDKVGGDHRTTRPSLDRLLVAALVHFFDFISEMAVNKRPFFQ